MPINIPESQLPRIVIVGAGFAGLTLARKINSSKYQVVVLDRNNFHQFQPLLYQVAMSGIEPSSIAFPLRKLFRKKPNVHIRMAEIQSIRPSENYVMTDEGRLNYDYLVIATGVTSNYFGNSELEAHAHPLKSVSEALFLRNSVLTDLEEALTIRDQPLRKTYMNIVIAGGGPTGVEMAGSFAEMKRFILPKDYPELNPEEMDIYLIEGNTKVLGSMSPQASDKSKEFLEKMGVDVLTNCRVVSFDGSTVKLSTGKEIASRKLIWAAGITGVKFDGLPEEIYTRGSRITTNTFSQVTFFENIFCIGDAAYMEEGENKGHPQVAQPAIQQAKRLAENFDLLQKGKPMKPFQYNDLGSLATIGRNKAVADLPFWKTQGFIAWVLWLVVHLKSILGVKNKLLVLMNWVWAYFTLDQSLRIIVRPKVRKT